YVVCTDKDDYDFSRTESVEVAVDASGTGDSYNKTTTDVVTDQTVTTTVFKYDKKKRVKQANITTVYNDASETA
ncbi:hypothetical protein, partial [Klebsiella pneumoniae]|uniref:hypothetical protein n=1 Tax=Klebsiella pneumoniae TaxID=573 RepID=UPI0025A19B4A